MQLQNQIPDAAAVGKILDRVLASDTFARSERARNLLRYLVTQEQAGNSERLKGFAIAVDVFGKDTDFDPSTDALVRVQAGRLRDLIDQYFSDEGADEPFRIIIPRGTYVPGYFPNKRALANETPLANDAGASHERGASNALVKPKRFRAGSVAEHIVRQLRLFWVAIAVVIGLLGFVAYQTYQDGSALSAIIADSSPGPQSAETIDSLPNIFIKASGEAGPQKLASVLRRALAGFDTVVYIANDPPQESAATDLDFVLVVQPEPDASANVTLQHVKNGQVILSRDFPDVMLASAKLDDQVADLITESMPVSGALYAFLETHSLQRGLARCLLLNDDYYLDQTSDKHRAAYQCFEQMEAKGARSPLIYSEMAALHLEAASDRYAYPPGATKEAALELARRGIQMAPTSPYAHRAYGFLYSAIGNPAESIRWMKKAHELSRYDLSMAAAYGYALIMAGEYLEGTPVLSHAVDVSSSRPSWWDYTLFLGEYMLGNMNAASVAADALSTSKRSHYLAARLLAAQANGDENAVELLRADLLERHKAFAANPRATFVKAGYPDHMIDKLVIGLNQAGLAGEG